MTEVNVHSFHHYIQRVEQRFDSYVEQGSDEELFLSGYLHGHFSLIVSEAELAQDFCLKGLKERMNLSLDKAFAEGELDDPDQKSARELMENVWHSA